MSYHDRVSALARDAEQMEQVYQGALKAGEEERWLQRLYHAYSAGTVAYTA